MAPSCEDQAARRCCRLRGLGCDQPSRRRSRWRAQRPATSRCMDRDRRRSARPVSVPTALPAVRLVRSAMAAVRCRNRCLERRPVADRGAAPAARRDAGRARVATQGTDRAARAPVAGGAAATVRRRRATWPA